MIEVDDIVDMRNELLVLEKNIENNIRQTNLIIIQVDDDKIENIIKKKQTFKDDIVRSKLLNDILNRINEKYCKDLYEIRYLLNFEVIKNIDELKNLDVKDMISDKNYKLNIINNINNINNINIINNKDKFFTNENALIFILYKLEKKYYIKIRERKHNSTKKRECNSR